MAILTLVYEGDELLRKKSRTVKEINERVLKLLDDMKDTLENAKGAGLAAVQVGVLRRVVVINAGDGPVEMINPELISVSGSREVVEGCLSCPKKWALKTRPAKVTARAQDRSGKWITYHAQGLFAQAICHEIDHLNGILFVDDIIRYISEEELE